MPKAGGLGALRCSPLTPAARRRARRENREKPWYNRRSFYGPRPRRPASGHTSEMIKVFLSILADPFVSVNPRQVRYPTAAGACLRTFQTPRDWSTCRLPPPTHDGKKREAAGSDKLLAPGVPSPAFALTCERYRPPADTFEASGRSIVDRSAGFRSLGQSQGDIHYEAAAGM